MYQPYPRFANPLTQLDATAKNPLGCIYSPPANQGLPATTKGLGAQPVYKYVYFNDPNALTGSAQIAPAPVYYIDESFTTVTSNAANAFFTTGGACVAGYWMPNTTALGASQTAAQWYAQFVQSYGWLQIGGLLVGGLAPSTVGSNAAGNYITGLTTGSWVSTTNASQPVSSRVLGVQWTSITGGLCDVLVGGDSAFWGS